MKRTTLLLVLVGLALLAHTAWAMSSPNYKLDWFTPLTGDGGGAASSTHYAVNFTVGQTVVGALTSPSYGAGLGYWYGIGGYYQVYLPLILK